MSRRAINWSVVVFALTWFGVLVPVHNRGQIAPFGAARCADDHACCADGRHDQAPSQDDQPRPGRACAVCFFIAGLDAPPPPTLISHTFTLAGSFRAAVPAEPDAATPGLPIHSRAPPLS
jgi:hypothetical protein